MIRANSADVCGTTMRTNARTMPRSIGNGVGFNTAYSCEGVIRGDSCDTNTSVQSVELLPFFQRLRFSSLSTHSASRTNTSGVTGVTWVAVHHDAFHAG
jgi:hypothetical protein